MGLRALPGTGLGAADVMALAWPGQALDGVPHAVAVPALAAPAEHQPFNGGLWSPYQQLVVADRNDMDEQDDDIGLGPPDPRRDPRFFEPGYLPAGCFWSYPVQVGFGTWASGGGTDHYVSPLSDILHRHLGPDLMIASEAL